MENNQEHLIEEFKKKVEMIPLFLEKENIIKGYNNPKFKSWKTSTLRIIERLSGDKNSSYVKDFSNISFTPGAFISGMSNTVFYEAFVTGIETAECVLNDMIKEFETLGVPLIAKGNNKHSQNINIINNIKQNQSLNINIENCLKNELTFNQYEKLNEILQDKNKKTKGEKLKKFLFELGSETLAKILKDVLLGNLNC